MTAPVAPIARRVLVTGRVQGVAFRWSAQRQADRLGLSGWVRNLADGRVEAWIEGEPDAVAAMLSWLERGPSPAHVDRCEALEEAPTAIPGFEIRPTLCG